MDLQVRSLLDANLSFGASGLLQTIKLTREARCLRPFAQNPIVFACARVNARSAMSAPVVLFTSAEEDAPEAPKNDPLTRLLGRPNPLMSGRTMWGVIALFYQLAGGAYLFLNSRRTEERGGVKVDVIAPMRAGEMPVEVWPVRDDLVEPVLDERTKLPKAYRYAGGAGAPVEYPVHAVSHLYDMDPYSPLKGFGPGLAAWRAADHMFRAEAFDDALVENGGQIGGVFTHEEKRLTPEQLKAMKESIAKNAEKPREDRKNVVLPAGMKFTPTAFSPADMRAKEMRELKRDEVMACFGVPKTLLGFTDDVNRANSREVRRSYYENTVVPYLEQLQDALIAHFFPLLPARYHTWSVGFAIEKTPAMREDLDGQIKRVRDLMGCGLTFVEAADIVGLEHTVKDEGKRYIDSGLRSQEADEAAARAAEEPEPEEEDDDEEWDDDEKAARVAVRNRDARLAALATEEKRLEKHDRRFKKAILRVFDDFILASRKRLRDIASGSEVPAVLPVAASLRAWSWWDGDAAWSESTRAYAEQLGLLPDPKSERYVVTVKGVSEDELAALVLENQRKWGDELWAALSGPYKSVVEDSAAAAQKLVGGALIEASHPDVVQFMLSKQIKVVEGPMSVVAERVKRAIVEAMTSVGAEGTLADRVRESLEAIEHELRALQDQLGTRAAMIARTESSAASNAARTAQFSDSGISEHEWASAGDELVRDLHMIDGERRRIEERFSNGLRYPGDPEGAAGNVINCRCTTVPVI